MSGDLLTAVEIQIAIGGLIAAVVGLYFASLERKKAHPEEGTHANTPPTPI